MEIGFIFNRISPRRDSLERHLLEGTCHSGQIFRSFLPSKGSIRSVSERGAEVRPAQACKSASLSLCFLPLAPVRPSARMRRRFGGLPIEGIVGKTMLTPAAQNPASSAMSSPDTPLSCLLLKPPRTTPYCLLKPLHEQPPHPLPAWLLESARYACPLADQPVLPKKRGGGALSFFPPAAFCLVGST